VPRTLPHDGESVPGLPLLLTTALSRHSACLRNRRPAVQAEENNQSLISRPQYTYAPAGEAAEVWAGVLAAAAVAAAVAGDMAAAAEAAMEAATASSSCISSWRLGD